MWAGVCMYTLWMQGVQQLTIKCQLMLRPQSTWLSAAVLSPVGWSTRVRLQG
jgi:hypothetical protein